MELGTLTSGPHGNLIPNLKSHGRRIRERTHGCFAESRKNNRCLVRFECGVEKECTSNALRRENSAASIPVNETSAQEREQLVATGENFAAYPDPNVDANE